MAPWQKGILASFALAAAFLAGHLHPLDRAGEARDEQVAGHAVDAASADGAGPGERACALQLQAGIDAALQRHLAPVLEQLRAEHASPAGTESNLDASPANTATGTTAGEQQFAVAQQFMDERLAYGTWTDDDRAAFRRTMRGLPGAEAEYLLSAVFGAMNDGLIAIQTDGPPF